MCQQGEVSRQLAVPLAGHRVRLGLGLVSPCARPALLSLGFLTCKGGRMSYSHGAQLCAIKRRKPLFSPGRSGGLTRARGDAAHTWDPRCQTWAPEAQNQDFLLPLPSLGDTPSPTPPPTSRSLVVQLQGWSSHSPSPWPLSQPHLVSSGPLAAPTTQLLLLRPPLNPWSLNRLLAHPQPTPLKPANGFPPRASSDHHPQSQPLSRSTGCMSVFCPPRFWTKGPLLFLWGSAEQAPMYAECTHVLVCPTETSRVPAMCPQHDQG